MKVISEPEAVAKVHTHTDINNTDVSTKKGCACQTAPESVNSHCVRA